MLDLVLGDVFGVPVSFDSFVPEGGHHFLGMADIKTTIPAISLILEEHCVYIRISSFSYLSSLVLSSIMAFQTPG